MEIFGRAGVLLVLLLLAGCASLIEETGDVAVAAVRLPFRVAHAAVDAVSNGSESSAREE